MTEPLTHFAAVKQNAPTLVVFCKRPLINQGKARLAASIGAEAAYHIAQELLNCALDDAANWPGNLVITVSHAEDFAWAKTLLAQNHSVLAQPSGNLGERLNTIDQQLRAKGHSKLAFIGTDAPMLTPAHYQQTIAALNSHDFVLSRADDGGVGIMANSIAWPQLKPLPWSTSRLCERLLDTCLGASQQTHMIIPSYDIDEQSDLFKVSQDLREDPRASRQQLIAVINRLKFTKKSHHYA